MNKTLLIICLLNTFMAAAQKPGYTERANAYIQQYSAWAIEEQQRSGIPASITLAQGIYETGAGESELATEANNHFGIKCKKEWKGQTFAHTDDAPNECFRKYGCAKDSYKDHSDYLKNSPRYAALFTLEPTNYTAWATGLKRCGYATNPQYAQKLIKMVEDFELQQFTLAALNQRPAEVVPTQDLVQPAVYKVPAQQPATAVKTVAYQATETGVQLVNGIRAVYGHRGEPLLDKAIRYNVRYARLLEINELADAPLPRDMFIYLEKKNNKGAHATYTVKEGETIEYIAHEEGMNSRQLRIFNLLTKDEQPVAGAVLKLQEQSEERPATYLSGQAEKQGPNGNVRLLDKNKQEDKDYLPTRRAQATTAPVQEMEIGYGAERPAELSPAPAPVKQVPATAPTVTTRTAVQETRPAAEQTPAAVVKTVQPALKEVPAREVTTKETVATEEEPQDELSRLKARLDRAVYSRSSSNIKVSRNDEETIGPNPAAAATPAPAKAQEQSAGSVYHTVQKGETAYSIAQKYQVKMNQLREWNNLNFESIKVGQKLRVK